MVGGGVIGYFFCFGDYRFMLFFSFCFVIRRVRDLIKGAKSLFFVCDDFQELYFIKDIVEAGLVGDINFYYMVFVERGIGNCFVDYGGFY